MNEGVGEKSILGPLTNVVVLREIFKYLPTSSLLSCSRVNQFWKREARSFIRDFRECTIKVGYNNGNLWQSFLELDKVLREIDVIPFNSLRIVVTGENVKCDKETKMDAVTNLTTNFPLKFLSIYEDGGWKSCSGPVASTLLDLVRLNSSMLLELELQSGGRTPGLFRDWEPPEKFEKLKKLSIHSSVKAEKVQKIILGAPNLRSIHNNCLYMIRDNVIPQNKYGTLRRLAFGLEDIHRVETFADELDHLEEMGMVQQGRWFWWTLSRDADANKRRYLAICQKLLALNAGTLRNLHLCFDDDSLFSQLELPTLPAVQNSHLSVNNIAESLIGINFPGSFPNLTRILISWQSNLGYGDVMPGQDIIVAPNASQTMLELTVDSDTRISTPELLTLRRFFPNVIKFLMKAECRYPLEMMRNVWPNLLSLSTRLPSFQEEKMDAELFGSQLEFLRLQDTEFLKSVGTLKELERFEVEHDPEEGPGRVQKFRELVKTLLIGRRPGLKFKMDPIPYRSICWEATRFADLLLDFHSPRCASRRLV